MNSWQLLNKWFGPSAIKRGQGILSVLRLYKPRLVYAKNGWETPVEGFSTEGWNDKNIIEGKENAFKEIEEILATSNKVAFSYESKNLTSDQNLEYHNINMTFAYVLALAGHFKTKVSVLDWGAGMGHYYLMAKRFLPDVEINYHCVEVREMAKLGGMINRNVSWHSDENYLKNTYDLVMINASLQYVKEWKSFLKKLSSCVGSYLFVTRIPTVENVSGFVAIQSEKGVKMLHQQINSKELVSTVEDCGFQTMFEFLIGDRPFIKNAPEQCEMKGWLFKKQTNN